MTPPVPLRMSGRILEKSNSTSGRPSISWKYVVPEVTRTSSPSVPPERTNSLDPVMLSPPGLFSGRNVGFPAMCFSR